MTTNLESNSDNQINDSDYTAETTTNTVEQQEPRMMSTHASHGIFKPNPKYGLNTIVE